MTRLRSWLVPDGSGAGWLPVAWQGWAVVAAIVVIAGIAKLAM